MSVVLRILASVRMRALFVWMTVAATAASGSGRPLTVSSEIGIASFVPYFGVPPSTVSPNGRFIAVRVERGLLSINRVEDELRVYDMVKLKRFLELPGARSEPTPDLILREATYTVGPIISNIRWLPDSQGLAFLRRNSEGINELMIMGLRDAHPTTLSLKGQDVTAFDVRNASQYVYAVLALGASMGSLWVRHRVVSDGTGKSLAEILLPAELEKTATKSLGPPNSAPLRSALWEAIEHRPRPVRKPGGQPVILYPDSGTLALSPDGSALAATVPVDRVPDNWGRLFLSPKNYPASQLRAGRQDLDYPYGWPVAEYAIINLKGGDIKPINDSPTGVAAGWYVPGTLAWSDDGSALVLPNAYIKPESGLPASEPCVAVFYRENGASSCVKVVRSAVGRASSTSGEVIRIESERFVGAGINRIALMYRASTRKNGNAYERETTQIFARSPRRGWQILNTERERANDNPIEVSIEQGLESPPVVVAENTTTGLSRVIWNPNPQLADVDLGKVTEYHWKDQTGHEWTGGLYWPAKYATRVRYPLVVQTHGFGRDKFSSSGLFPTAMAARALAASGMAVLQIPYCTPNTPESGRCDRREIEAAVTRLSEQGLVDPRRVGLIGFSYTVYTALEALTTSSVQFAAASITDGWSYGYWEYLTELDEANNGYAALAESMIGVKPFGGDLRVWLTRSPDFNLDRVHTPLLVNSLGKLSLLVAMWEPYAALRYLHKPVDLVLLDSDEHVLTNPAVRLASQGGSVDWFRFWLDGYESPKPVMQNEYRRWEQLCKMQKSQNPGRPAFCVSQRSH
jgi:hypothetical protein